MERLYFWLAWLVLAGFYGTYFIKMGCQKCRGIQTQQIGRRREKTAHAVELMMGAATLAAPAVQMGSIVTGWSCLPSGARFVGFCMGGLGDLVFLTAVLCMKDSWRAGIPDRDRTELVTDGIYRYSRNPAFVGFDLQYAGMVLLYGNPLTLAVSAFAAGMLHLQILQEEQYLLQTFGAPYQTYCSRVRRYWGRK